MGDARCLLELPETCHSQPGQRLHRAHVITTTSGRNAVILYLISCSLRTCNNLTPLAREQGLHIAASPNALGSQYVSKSSLFSSCINFISRSSKKSHVPCLEKVNILCSCSNPSNSVQPTLGRQKHVSNYKSASIARKVAHNRTDGPNNPLPLAMKPRDI